MAKRRRTQWVDALNPTLVTVNGAAAPGTISEAFIISEAELENLGGMATATRIVGSINFVHLLGIPVLTAVLYLRQEYAGVVSPVDWTQDVYQRMGVMWTMQRTYSVGASDAMHVNVDIRTQRKIGQGRSLTLAVQNHAIAGNNAAFTFHLRALLLL